MITCHRCASTSVDRLTSTASTVTYRCMSCTQAWTQQRFANLDEHPSAADDQRFRDCINDGTLPVDDENDGTS